MSTTETIRQFDPRIRRTRGVIRDSFLQLMKTKDYDAITVTDISRTADINRKTFYAHFETKEQLFTDMITEMFSDLFGCFMYEKEKPEAGAAREIIQKDARRFFEKADLYREILDTLITEKTSVMAFAIADRVIQEDLEKVHVRLAKENGRVPAALLIMRIKNFFLTALDWWLEQDELAADEAAEIFSKMMRKSIANIFRYQQM